MPKTASPAQAEPAERSKPAHPPTRPSKDLLVFPNPHPGRDLLINLQVPEFTCLCPLTGQPDFAHFTIDYVPDARCVELKALKMYMWSFRDEGAFHEKVTGDILDKLVASLAPRYCRVLARWWVRGGIYTNIAVEHRKRGWKPRVDLGSVGFGTAAPLAPLVAGGSVSGQGTPSA
jgi:7-cyano-7-deazaguanine reductase